VLRHARTVGDIPLQALMVASPEDGDRARTVADEAFAQFSRTLDEMVGPEGAVNRINRDAGVAPVAVSPDAFAALSEALRICILTDGAFDPTAAAYEGLWAFGATNTLPAPEDLARRTALVDCRQLVLDSVTRTAFLKKPGMRLTLWDLPRAMALDRALAVLRNKGFGDAIIYAGGDLVVSGHKAGRRWMVGVQDPRGQGHFAALPVQGGAVFTCGDYEQSFFDRGRRMHSVLEPRSGLPARSVRSATVLAPGSVEAAALSRAVFILGPDRGMKLVQRLPNVEAVMVDDHNRVLVTRGVQASIRHRPPTDGP